MTRETEEQRLKREKPWGDAGYEVWIKTHQPRGTRPVPWQDEGIVSWVLAQAAFASFVLTLIFGVWAILPLSWELWDPFFSWWRMALICVAFTAASVATDKLRGKNDHE